MSMKVFWKLSYWPKLQKEAWEEARWFPPPLRWKRLGEILITMRPFFAILKERNNSNSSQNSSIRSFSDKLSKQLTLMRAQTPTFCSWKFFNLPILTITSSLKWWPFFRTSRKSPSDRDARIFLGFTLKFWGQRFLSGYEAKTCHLLLPFETGHEAVYNLLRNWNLEG